MINEPADRPSPKRRLNVLVTGGAGYIGSHAVLALSDAGHSVAVIDNLSTGFRNAVPGDVRFHFGDVGDASLLDSIFHAEPFDAVMHFAGSIIVPESVRQPLDYYHNNTSNSRTLLAATVRAGIPAMVFSSTAAVYGQPESLPIDEDARTDPINPYGASKLMTERMLRDASDAYGLQYAALRYFNVAGADPQGRSGQSTLAATHLIKIACEAVAGKRSHVAVFGTDYDTEDGTAVRDYVHVSDLAAAHILALDHLIEGGRSFVANCGYGAGFSVSAVLDAVERVSGVSTNRLVSPRREGDPPELVANCDKIKELLGWQPRYDNLELIVEHALAWERRDHRGSPEPALVAPSPVPPTAIS